MKNEILEEIWNTRKRLNWNMAETCVKFLINEAKDFSFKKKALYWKYSQKKSKSRLVSVFSSTM